MFQNPFSSRFSCSAVTFSSIGSNATTSISGHRLAAYRLYTPTFAPTSKKTSWGSKDSIQAKVSGSLVQKVSWRYFSIGVTWSILNGKGFIPTPREFQSVQKVSLLKFSCNHSQILSSRHIVGLLFAQYAKLRAVCQLSPLADVRLLQFGNSSPHSLHFPASDADIDWPRGLINRPFHYRPELIGRFRHEDGHSRHGFH